MENLVRSILITGGTGFIGTNLVQYFSNKGCIVYVLALKSDETGIKRISHFKNVHIITDTIDMMIQENKKYPVFDTVFHLASYGVNTQFQNIERMCDVNIKMLGYIIDFCCLNKTKLLINTGSCFEYGDNDKVLLNEDHICKPESLYAASKYAAFTLMNVYARQKKVSMITVRPFGVFGIYEASYRLFPQVLMSGITNKELNLTGGEQIRDFLNVKEVVMILDKISLSKRIKMYEIYNICSGYPVSIKEFVKQIIDICQFDSNLYHFGVLPYRSNESMYFAGNNEKLLTVIDHDFYTDQRKGIEEAKEWFMKILN